MKYLSPVFTVVIAGVLALVVAAILARAFFS